MEGLIIKPLVQVNSSDTRGPTYEIWKGLDTKQLTFCERYKGTFSGNHYHKGEDQSKNPEKFLIIHGKLRIRICDGTKTIEQLVEEPYTEVHISPNILHAFIAEEFSRFVEQRSTIFDKSHSDTYPANIFESYLREANLPVNPSEIERFLYKQEKKLK